MNAIRVNVYPNPCSTEPSKRRVLLADVIPSDSEPYRQAVHFLTEAGRYWHGDTLLIRMVP